MKKKRVAYTKCPMTPSAFFRAYANLATTDRQILLESASGGRWSIAGIDALATYESTPEENVLVTTWADGQIERQEGDPLTLLERRLHKYTFEVIDGLPPFQGGVLGYMSYDYVRRYIDLPTDTVRDIDIPDLYFYLFDRWAVLDHEREEVFFITLSGCQSCAETMKDEWLAMSERPLEKTKRSTRSAVSVIPSKETFVQSVQDIQSSIQRGDVEQVNISLRQQAETNVRAIDLYRSLRQLNPSPYMGWMSTPLIDIVSGSPELLLRKRGNIVTTRPIGGTASRGETKEEDETNRRALQSSEKDMTEHEMLVELECKDFRKVCDPSTVQVTASQVVETYSHVFHLVSEVEGQLNEGVQMSEWVRAIFPGGSITGDPKVPTLEIIERLETVQRGLYTGALGWIGFNGDVEWNILIRTALLYGGNMYVQAGAGITIDSDPHSEYEESLTKGRALWQAEEQLRKEEKE